MIQFDEHIFQMGWNHQLVMKVLNKNNHGLIQVGFSNPSCLGELQYNSCKWGTQDLRSLTKRKKMNRLTSSQERSLRIHQYEFFLYFWRNLKVSISGQYRQPPERTRRKLEMHKTHADVHRCDVDRRWAGDVLSGFPSFWDESAGGGPLDFGAPLNLRSDTFVFWGGFEIHGVFILPWKQVSLVWKVAPKKITPYILQSLFQHLLF